MRRALIEDADAIARVMGAVWPDEPPDAGHIARVISRGRGCTLVAEAAGEIVGFIDAFGTEVWELDLMAVAPEAQGRGIGRRLATACLEEGRAEGYNRARGLVATENLASQGVMGRLGLAAGVPVALYVQSGGTAARGGVAPANVTEVYTFRYHGGWVNPPFSAEGLRAAAAMGAEKGWDVVGAVIPLGDPSTIDALRSGYAFAGLYQWWS